MTAAALVLALRDTALIALAAWLAHEWRHLPRAFRDHLEGTNED